MNEEHGFVDITHAERQFAIGDRVHIIPNHICVAVNLHEQVYGVRGDRVEEVWKVEGPRQAAIGGRAGRTKLNTVFPTADIRDACREIATIRPHFPRRPALLITGPEVLPMAKKERIREALTGLPTLEYLMRRIELGWRPSAIEWERDIIPEGADPRSVGRRNSVRAAGLERLRRPGGKPVGARDHHAGAGHDRGGLPAFARGRRTESARLPDARRQSVDAERSVLAAAADDPGRAQAVHQRAMDHAPPETPSSSGLRAV